MKSSIVSIFVIFIMVVGVWSIYARDVLPTGLKRLFFLAVEPDDLYKPVILEPFNFWENGYTATYDLNFKYDNTYAVSIESEKGKDCIPSGWGTKEKYHLRGKIAADFFHKEALVFSKVITSEESVFYQEGNMDCLKKIVLLSVDFPLEKKYRSNIRLKLTVLEPDQYLKKFREHIKLSVAVSGTK